MVEDLLKEMKRLADITEIEIFIENHARNIGIALFPNDAFVEQIPKAFSVKMDKVVLNHYAINKHSCPIGRKKNISRVKNSPLFYPALTGKLILEKDPKIRYPYFGLKKILQNMNIYVKQYSYKWDFTLWTEDFPQLGVMWVLSGGRIKSRDDETLDIVP
jgi:hypothetical protein